MRELSPEASAFIEKLLDARGGILTAFAQVEWFLAKLISEASKYEQYSDLNLNFSQDAATRAERLRAILNREGPLSPYKSDLLLHMGRVLEQTELRTMAAHGLLVRPDEIALNSPVHFRMFRAAKGGAIAEEKLDLTVKSYTDRTATLSSSAREFMRVVRKIWVDLKLEGLDPSA